MARVEVLWLVVPLVSARGLTADELGPLAQVATTRRLGRGEVVVRVGDPADELYVVATGEVKDSVVDADGEEVVHFLHGPGMTFGEPGFFAVQHRRIVHVVATVPSVLVRLDRPIWCRSMNRYPETKDRVLEKLASNERWQTTMISSLATKPLRTGWCCGCWSWPTPALSVDRARR